MSTVITSVDAGSPAERAGIRAGEQLLMINHHEIVDVLDYRFFCYDPSVSLRLREADGTTRHLTIEKEEGEDLGLNFDTYLMAAPLLEPLPVLLCRSDAAEYARHALF